MTAATIQRTRILIIEDNSEVVDTVRLTLSLRWPEASLIAASEGADGLRQVLSESPDLVILDLGLPDMDGFELLRRMRETFDKPVLVLTGRTDELSKVRALDEGASEYVTKPFKHSTLLERLRSLQSRQQRGQGLSGQKPFAGRGLAIDFAAARVSLDGKPVRLTITEYVLLGFMAINAGSTMTYRSLQSNIWGESSPDTMLYLTAHVERLRRKIERDPSHPQLILTEKNVGYRLSR